MLLNVTACGRCTSHGHGGLSAVHLRPHLRSFRSWWRWLWGKLPVDYRGRHRWIFRLHHSSLRLSGRSSCFGCSPLSPSFLPLMLFIKRHPHRSDRPGRALPIGNASVCSEHNVDRIFNAGLRGRRGAGRRGGVDCRPCAGHQRTWQGLLGADPVLLFVGGWRDLASRWAALFIASLLHRASCRTFAVAFNIFSGRMSFGPIAERQRTGVYLKTSGR